MSKRRKIIILLAFYFILVAIIYFIFTRFFSVIKIDGISMSPTYENGNLLLVRNSNNDIERFDVIVYATTQSENTAYIIKRVIGLPGETVYIDNDNTIYINGEAVSDTYGYYDDTEGYLTGLSFVLNDDEYFCLGDNRNHSIDSRANGAVSKERILGTVLIRYYPIKFNKISFSR